MKIRMVMLHTVQHISVMSVPDAFSYVTLQSSFSASTHTFLRFVLKGFSKDGRDLTDDETKTFLTAADKDGDGKIGIDGERE